MIASASAWASFYEGRSGADYLAYARQRYAPFIRAITDRLHNEDRVLELGCGTGTITNALLDTKAANYTASDVDSQMLVLTRRRLGSRADVIQMDAAQSPTLFADVVHSHGMLEHFDDETIRRIVRIHRHARVQVHYVPGLYPAPSYGDERLMSVEQWQDICAPDQIFTFNEGLDYALIFGN